MKATVVGVGQRRSGTAKKTNNPYDGTTIYCLTAANDVEGHRAEEIYLNHLSKISFPEIHVGDEINVDYNRQGFIEEITVIERTEA